MVPCKWNDSMNRMDGEGEGWEHKKEGEEEGGEEEEKCSASKGV